MRPAYYVLNLQSWQVICSQLGQASVQGVELTGVNPLAFQLLDAQPAPARLAQKVERVSDQGAFEKKNNFTALAETLINSEWERVSRDELSASSVGIQKNRLDAHVLPFFKYIPPHASDPCRFGWICFALDQAWIELHHHFPIFCVGSEVAQIGHPSGAFERSA